MIMQEDSDKSYPLMVAYHQMMFEYSIIMHHIIHSFEIDTFLLLNLLKLSILLKRLIYRNKYLTFHNKMDQKGNLGDM